MHRLTNYNFTSSLTFTADAERTTLSDKSVVLAAKASNSTDGEYRPESAPGMIKFLVSAGHGSPFEHTVLSGVVEAPIFVAREFMRHRLASYNELSHRYMIMDDLEFYLPPKNRPLVESGRVGEMRMSAGTPSQDFTMEGAFASVCAAAARAYNEMLDAGIAREVASRVLPVTTMTRFLVTMNARSLSNFLSLRIFAEDADRPSFPQWEIEQVAKQMEAVFQERMPLTHAAWTANGRRPL